MSNQAFPSGYVKKARLRPHDPGSDFHVSEIQEAQNKGMTLRDYFAAKAMQGFIVNPNWLEKHVNIAKEAYLIADDMLEARKK